MEQQHQQQQQQETTSAPNPLATTKAHLTRLHGAMQEVGGGVGWEKTGIHHFSYEFCLLYTMIWYIII